MNPELTRTTHDEATLHGAKVDILSDDGKSGKLVTSRQELAQAKATARQGRLGGFLGNNAANQEAQRKAEEKNKITADYIQIEARRRVDKQQEDSGIVLNRDQYLDALGQAVGELSIKEKQNETAEEIRLAEEAEAKRRFPLLRRIARNGVARAAIGWGLNIGIGSALVTGNVPLAGVLMTGRVVFGAYGTEAVIRGGMDQVGQVLSRRDAGAIGLEEVNRRLDGLAEMRIRDKSRNMTDTERILYERKKQLLADAIRNNLTAAGVENWKELRQGAEAGQLRINAINAEIATKTQEATHQKNLKDTAALEKAAAETGKRNHETAKTNAEAAKKVADDEMAMANDILSSNPPDGIMYPGLPVGARTALDTAVQNIITLEEEIAALEARTPQPILQINKKKDEIGRIRYNRIMPLVVDGGPTDNVSKAIETYKELKKNEKLSTDANTAIGIEDTAITTAQAVVDAKETAIQAAELAEQAARDYITNTLNVNLSNETKRMNDFNNLTGDQAILIYNILVGGGNRAAVAATADASARRNISDITYANSLLGQEAATRSATNSIDRERALKRGRWLGALLVSGAVTLASQGALEQSGAPIRNFVGEKLQEAWNNVDLASAAEQIQQTLGGAGETAGGVRDALNNAGFFDQVVTIKEQGGNFWNSLNLGGLENNWSNVNGVKKADAIKDMIIKFAQHNGHNISTVHVGDAFKLKDLLTPDQMDVVSQAMNTTDINSYFTKVTPSFQTLMSR